MDKFFVTARSRRSNLAEVMRTIITQSNYLPWKGYFDAIQASDLFVVFDEAQYTRRDWRNRNKIKTPEGTRWLSIPVEVKGRFTQKIKDTKAVDRSWQKQHVALIKQYYKQAACYRELIDFVESMYFECRFDFLSDINIHFIERICQYLGIECVIQQSSEFKLVGDKNKKLLDICKAVGANEYYTGPAAKAYLDETLFAEQNISVRYFDYSTYKEYPQLYPPFDHHVSVIDLLLNTGSDACNYLWSHPKVHSA